MSLTILWKASKLAASLLILNWSFFMIIEHAVPSLALNYPCKKYKIVDENVHCFLCSCMRNKYPCKSESVRSVHIQVMFKVISFSIFNMHELVETCMVARVIVFEIPRLTCTVKRTLSLSKWIIWQFVQMSMDSKFQSKLHVLETDDVKQRLCRFLFRENVLGIVFLWILLFRLHYLCPVPKINAQTPITAILSTHSVHEFIVNVMSRMDWSYRKPYICLSFDFLKQCSANGTCLTLMKLQEYVTSLWLLWKG